MNPFTETWAARQRQLDHVFAEVIRLIPMLAGGYAAPVIDPDRAERLLPAILTEIPQRRHMDARKPGALRNGAPFKDWVLPAAMERIRRKLASVDDGGRQMVDILTAVLTDGLPAVEAACTEAIAEGVHSADAVLNMLARRRNPEPPPTIFIPAALPLRHATVADCARYDNLRRNVRWNDPNSSISWVNSSSMA
jgi:hypothetical protein